MAKIFISSTEELKPLKDIIENTLKKNSGHRPALYQNTADFTIDLTQDWAGGSKGLDPLIHSNDYHISNMAKTITEIFKENAIQSQYPKRAKEEKKDFLTLRVARVNHPIDIEFWGELIAMGIIKYFNPDYVSQGKNEKEPTVKRSQDKTYYDRSFNNNSTSNASLIFRKGKK